MRKVGGILLIIVGILFILAALVAVLVSLTSYDDHHLSLLASNIGFVIGCLILPGVAIILGIILIRVGRRLTWPKTKLRIRKRK